MRVPEIQQHRPLHQPPEYPSPQPPGYPSPLPPEYPPPTAPYTIHPSYNPSTSLAPELRVPLGICWRCRKLYQDPGEV